MQNWRNHPLFVFGYLPIRAVIMTVGFLAAFVFAACCTLLWLQPEKFKPTFASVLASYQ